MRFARKFLDVEGNLLGERVVRMVVGDLEVLVEKGEVLNARELNFFVTSLVDRS